MPALCPCGTGEPFGMCCRPLLRGDRSAATAEQLMRSRYTAYVRGDQAYLLRTWHRESRPEHVETDADWRGLEVHATTDGREGDVTGVVEFTGYYAIDKVTTGRLHETSRFLREHGVWFYLYGDTE